MVMSAITQMLREVPGAISTSWSSTCRRAPATPKLTMAPGDAAAGAVIVSTPQDLALIDARRGVTMFKQVEVPILGIVENMATFVCPNAGHESTSSDMAARGRGERLGVPFLGEVPLTWDPRIVGCGPAGRRRSRPTVRRPSYLQGHGPTGASRLVRRRGRKRRPRIVME